MCWESSLAWIGGYYYFIPSQKRGITFTNIRQSMLKLKNNTMLVYSFTLSENNTMLVYSSTLSENNTMLVYSSTLSENNTMLVYSNMWV
jgi:outer membrane protein assembly factor BamB